jgi:hypothetical protein
MSMEAVGLTGIDSAVYEASIRFPGRTAVELAALADQTQHLTRQALARLVSYGLVSLTPERRPRYSPTPPDTALTALIHQHEEDLSAVRVAARKLAILYEQSQPNEQVSGLVQVVEGRDAITRVSWQLIAGALDQIRWFDRPPYPNDPPNALLDAEKAALQRGVPIRMIFAKAGIAWPGRLDELHDMAGCGEQIRVLPELPVKMGIIDERLAILPVITPSHSHDAAYLVHRSSLLDALTALFEHRWADALPLPTFLARPDATPGQQEETQAAPTKQQARLLVMLSAGLPDDAMARATGWSLRTVQRRLHDLMDSLGVQTRFQAGMAAHARGWIGPQDPNDPTSSRGESAARPNTPRQTPATR